VLLAGLSGPRDQCVTAVPHQADRPIVLMDVGITLPVGLDEMRLVIRPHLRKASRAIGEPDEVLPKALSNTVDVIDSRGSAP
jgi:hypothetical protein